MFGKKFEKEFKVEGMHCNHCAEKVKKALLNVKGVKSADVDAVSGNVKITSKTEIDNSVIASTIENLGYKMCD